MFKTCQSEGQIDLSLQPLYSTGVFSAKTKPVGLITLCNGSTGVLRNRVVLCQFCAPFVTRAIVCSNKNAQISHYWEITDRFVGEML